MDYSDLIRQYAASYKLDPRLIWAICKTESKFNPLAVRFEAQWRYSKTLQVYANKNSITYDTERILQACSWGLMQIMGTCARELNYDDSLLKLTQVEIGLELGCQHLQKITLQYDLLENVISSYNMGTFKKLGNGSYFNQQYVDKVKGNMKICPL